MNTQLFIKRIIKLARITCSLNWLRGLFHGVAATTEHIKVLRSLSINTVLDIGANKGQFTLACLNYFPSAQYFAFEPQHEPFTKFCNLFSGRENISAYQVAISQEISNKEMYISEKRDCSSLLPISKQQLQLFPGTAFSHNETVRLAPLDTFIKSEQLVSPTLMKIDVQGSELSVLQGSLKLLSCIDHIYVECSFVELYEGQALADEVTQFLQHHGFVLAGIYDPVYDNSGKTIQADFLFNRV